MSTVLWYAWQVGLALLGLFFGVALWFALWNRERLYVLMIDSRRETALVLYVPGRLRRLFRAPWHVSAIKKGSSHWHFQTTGNVVGPKVVAALQRQELAADVEVLEATARAGGAQAALDVVQPTFDGDRARAAIKEMMRGLQSRA